jgi:hypothetical protein
MRITTSVFLGLAIASSSAQGQQRARGCAMAFTGGCQATVDVFEYLVPQLGAAVTGGNATLGQGGAMAGAGHFALTLRGNVSQGSLPDLRRYDPGATTASTKLDTKSSFLPLPSVDASIGVYGGYPIGVTRVGGVDVLLSSAIIPSFRGGTTSLELPDGSVKLGYGARVGLLEEGLLTPGLGFTWMRRYLPRMNVVATDANTWLRVDDIDVATTSWRVTATKSLIAFGVAAGIGQDSYHSSATIQKALPSTSGPFRISQGVRRMSWFGDLSTNVLLAKLVAEIGGVSGGNIRTYNTFAGKSPDAFRLYGSLGVRIGI